VESVEVSQRKASSRTPILSLVDREYLKSTANLPRSAWEAISYLYSEADKAVARVKAMSVPVEHEWAREATLKSWEQMHGWLDEILLQSQSIDALRSWQMMGGLQGQNQQQRPTANVVMPDFPQPQPPAQRRRSNGLLKRQEAGP
jgi:hypothetical protein